MFYWIFLPLNIHSITIKTSSKFILGTAMWGWTMPPQQCFQVLDAFYKQGGREVDCATNYPINKNAKDFRAAENILLEWIKTHGVNDLEVMMKIGSLNNLGTSDHNLAASFLLLSGKEYQNKFKSNLSTLMVHWDNREDVNEIRQSMEVFQAFQEEGLKVGFSGIKNPELYAEALKDNPLNNLRIQIKHNLLYSDYQRYAPLHDKTSFIAYGINAGGLKLNAGAYESNASLLARGGKVEQHRVLINKLNALIQATEQKSQLTIPSRMNHLGLLYAIYHPAITQVLLGVSSVEQLQDSWEWLAILESEDYADFYALIIGQK